MYTLQVDLIREADKAVFVVAEDQCFTVFKSQGGSGEAVPVQKYVCVMEDAYGDWNLSMLTEDNLRIRFHKYADEILSKLQ